MSLLVRTVTGRSDRCVQSQSQTCLSWNGGLGICSGNTISQRYAAHGQFRQSQTYQGDTKHARALGFNQGYPWQILVLYLDDFLTFNDCLSEAACSTHVWIIQTSYLLLAFWKVPVQSHD